MRGLRRLLYPTPARGRGLRRWPPDEDLRKRDRARDRGPRLAAGRAAAAHHGPRHATGGMARGLRREPGAAWLSRHPLRQSRHRPERELRSIRRAEARSRHAALRDRHAGFEPVHAGRHGGRQRRHPRCARHPEGAHLRRLDGRDDRAADRRAPSRSREEPDPDDDEHRRAQAARSVDESARRDAGAAEGSDRCRVGHRALRRAVPADRQPRLSAGRRLCAQPPADLGSAFVSAGGHGTADGRDRGRRRPLAAGRADPRADPDHPRRGRSAGAARGRA